MNNKTASMIRDFGMARVFDGMDFSELVKIDSGKFVFPVDTDDGMFWCEVDFVAKKEDYTPDYDVKKYAEKKKRKSTPKNCITQKNVKRKNRRKKPKNRQKRRKKPDFIQKVQGNRVISLFFY